MSLLPIWLSVIWAFVGVLWIVVGLANLALIGKRLESGADEEPKKKDSTDRDDPDWWKR